MKPLLIGQAPGPNTLPSHPLFPAPSTSTGARLQRMMGLSRSEYLRQFDRMNLLRAYPGAWANGDKFPLTAARVAAQAIEPLLRDRVVVLVGRNVAEAFGHGHLDFFVWEEAPAWGYHFATIPHPSGRNHWYNRPENLARAKEFWEAHSSATNGVQKVLAFLRKESHDSPTNLEKES